MQIFSQNNLKKIKIMFIFAAKNKRRKPKFMYEYNNY